MSCKICGEIFTGHGLRKYCGDDCKREAHRLRYWSDGKERKYNKSWPKDMEANEYQVWYKYGLYLSEYEQMMEKGCAICGGTAEALDHNHKTGQPRAALCQRHNIAVGYFELPEAQKIQDYLMEWK